MRRAFFFIVAVCLATSSFASIPRASVLELSSVRFDPLPETRIRLSEDLAPFERPAPSLLSRALHQGYERAGTTNASGLARFLSVDPIVDEARSLTNPQGWNRYAYALNNPLRYTDPTGMMWFKVDGKWEYRDGVDRITQWDEKKNTLTVIAGTKQFLAFDGGTLKLYGANGKVSAFPAVSGVPGSDGRSQPSMQGEFNRGPAVEGRYNIFPQSGIQTWGDLTPLQKVASLGNRGPWPGWPGRGAWGTARAQLYPDAATRAQIKALGRTGNFFIHGGWTAGSAGCIDVCGNDAALFGLIDKTTNEAVPVFIDYKP